MHSVEARIGTGVQGARIGQPPIEERREDLPWLTCPLAAAHEKVVPHPVHAQTEGPQAIEIAGDSVVLVVTGDDLPEPCTDLADAIMLPAAQLCLDGFQLRHHPLLRCKSPD